MTAVPASLRTVSPFFAHAIPCLILSVVATVLFWWNPFGKPAQWATFHVLMLSDNTGEAQLTPGGDNTDIHSGETFSQPVVGGGRLNHIQFRIPTGRLYGFLFKGLDRPGTVEIQKSWITNASGEVAAIISPASMQSSIKDVRPGSVAGSVRYQVKPGDVLSGLSFKLKSPLDLTLEPPPPMWQIAVVFLATLSAGILLSSYLVRRRDAIGRALGRIRNWCEARPRRALLLAAIFSVAVSAFPVICGGKSYV